MSNMKPKCQKLKGPLYSHLGHFSQDRYVEKGHNENGKIKYDFSDKPLLVEKNYEDSQKIKDRINLRKKISIESGQPESMMPSPRMKKREGYRK